jgi:hypothetical protein
MDQGSQTSTRGSDSTTVGRAASREQLTKVHVGAVHPSDIPVLSYLAALMAGMIGMALQNGEGAVDLLEQDHAGQFVGERHFAERESVMS